MPKRDPNLLTQAEYARSRKARGLSGGSREAVRKAVDAQRISVFGPDKMIDADLADRQWEKNTRVRATTVDPAAPTSATSAQPAGDLVDLAGAGQSAAEAAADGAAQRAPAEANEDGRLQADPGYQKSRAREAAAAARTAEIKLAELEESLIRVDQVKAQLASMLAPVREGLLQIPARLAPLLAPQSDPGRIQTLLEIEIHKVLSPLSKVCEVRPAEHSGGAPNAA